MEPARATSSAARHPERGTSSPATSRNRAWQLEQHVSWELDWDDGARSSSSKYVRRHPDRQWDGKRRWRGGVGGVEPHWQQRARRHQGFWRYRNRVSANEISGNGGLGIDLDGNGVSGNDAGDGDTGPNNLQNFPTLTSASGGASTSVSGSLDSAPGRIASSSSPTRPATGRTAKAHASWEPRMSRPASPSLPRGSARPPRARL